MTPPTYEGQLVHKPDGWYVGVTTVYQDYEWHHPLVKLDAVLEDDARTEATARITRFASACAGSEPTVEIQETKP